MAILDTIMDMDIDEAREHLTICGYDDGDIIVLLAERAEAQKAPKPVVHSAPTRRPSPIHIDDDEDDE